MTGGFRRLKGQSDTHVSFLKHHCSRVASVVSYQLPVAVARVVTPVWALEGRQTSNELRGSTFHITSIEFACEDFT
jgi:hypothetical protein